MISTTVKLKLVGGRILMTSGLLESLKTNNIRDQASSCVHILMPNFSYFSCLDHALK